jgi:tRNA-dihydrouridine synthase A
VRGGQLTRAMTVSCPSHTPPPPQRLSVAPMMDWTDLHYRQLARMLSRNVWLYTEMVVDSTLIHNTNHHRFLWFPPEQHPISCQLGGSNPESLAQAAAIVAKFGYDEINLNCGCPSDRVAGAGCFGAALMLRAELVADCCAAMSDAVEGRIPITVKCRLGVDNVDSYDALHKFISVVSSRSPVRHFMIHARKCLLKGLNPAQNRSIPPLRYNWVWALKRDFPHLQFTLNGGILTLDQTIAALQLRAPIEEGKVVGGLEGVMVGRAAYNDPWGLLAGADVAIWGEESNPSKNRRELLRRYAAYADAMIGSIEIKEDGYKVPSVRTLVKPLLGMFHQERKGKKWRAAVDDALRKSSTVSEVLDSTLHVLLPETLDAPPRIPMVEDFTFDACREALIYFPPALPFLDNHCQGEVQEHDVDQEQCAVSL